MTPGITKFQQILLFALIILPLSGLRAQQQADPNELLGEYRADLAIPIICRIHKDKEKLMLQIVGQGTTELIPQKGDIFWPKFVNPRVNLAFIRDSLGRIKKFRWTQKEAPAKWTRTSATAGNTLDGSYKLNDNPYQVFHITKREGHLQGHMSGQQDSPLTSLGNDRFSYTASHRTYTVMFSKNGQQLITTSNSPIDFIKVSSEPPHISNRANGFTRADSLQGALTPLRTCYDVLFYDLDILVAPETKSIKGNTAIRFKALHTFDRMQIDLFANMKIEKILFHGQELTWTRECNAVFIQFPTPVKEDSREEIRVLYSGAPVEPDIDAGKGGWFWLWNRDHKIWIETVSQGIGASMWWPCKDHLSDRPDSMRISVTFPGGLKEISNGRLLARTDLPDGQTRCVWYVSYPINTYDVVVNIGDYIQYDDTFIDGADTLAMHFYCMPYNLRMAKKIFSQARSMLSLYIKDFGSYPFRKDGFTLMESIYPMEHQGAVSIGSLSQPFNGSGYDSAESVRTIWHESAHEWWGNNVGCKDYADLWIHEAFATYAEVLNYESVGGRPLALLYLHSEAPKNNEPIIGIYDVNNFHLGDMYTKGALMLHTLRNIIDNDSLWFSTLRGIQQRFRYQTVTTEEITGYFSKVTGKDYTWFFDQYLRYLSIPVLLLTVQEEADSLKIKYKWQTDRPGFCMPVKVTTQKGLFTFIYPGNDWQTMELKGMRHTDFRVDTNNFYIEVKETN